MATLQEIPGFNLSLIAATDLSAKQHYLVKIDTNGKAALAAAGEAAAGVLQDKPASGAVGTVQTSGVSRCVAGEAIAKGALVASNASGKAKPAVLGKTDTSDVGAAADPLIGSHVIGIALTAAGAEDEEFSLLIQPRGAVPTTAA